MSNSRENAGEKEEEEDEGDEDDEKEEEGEAAGKLVFYLAGRRLSDSPAAHDMNISSTETSFFVTLELHSHPRTHAHTHAQTHRHRQSDTYKSAVNSQVKAQILTLLKEIVQDKFADKVGVEGVVDDFRPAKLERKKPFKHMQHGKRLVAGQEWANYGLGSICGP